MSQKIHILPENLCNQIAAGEVVERPASVVKELLENSLDAGATEIQIQVEKGGKRLLRVIDNGAGMGKDDAFLCLERHATSKIRSGEDLFALRTLGFRGEALPSIASVSRLQLRTRSEDSVEGWEIYAEGGTVKRAGEVGTPCGTTLEVRDLFFNTPARRKFLRRDETELGHIGDVVNKLALANPAVQFRLHHNGRPILEVYRHSGLQERVAALLGRSISQELLPLEAEGGDGMALRGLISQPSLNRSTSGYVYAFINGRYIRDRVVQHAIMEGYRSLLMKGRYPVAVLFLDIDPGHVDVNVHPTKHEVRFRQQGAVHDFIAGSVRQALRSCKWLSDEGREPAGEEEVVSATPPRTVTTDRRTEATEGPAPRARERVQEALLNYSRRLPASGPSPHPVHRPSSFSMPVSEPEESGFFSSLRVIGQYRQSYILCQDGDDLILIDQHAAHERIGFERLKSQFEKGSVERQALLFPTMLELDYREGALLEEHLTELERLGFEIEPFGGKSFALKAVPRLLGDGEAEKLVMDVAGQLATVGKTGLVEEALEEVLILVACHGVIRANQPLSGVQITALLRDLDGVDFSAHCPHGRPVMKRLALAEVERMFKRN